MQTSSGISCQREPYPSDLSNAQWFQIEPSIPPEKGLGRHRSTNIREIVNGINYRWSTGCVWRMLPHDYPPWATVYTYFRRWQRDGTLREIRELLVRRRNLSEPKISESKTADTALHPKSCIHRDKLRRSEMGERSSSCPPSLEETATELTVGNVK